MKRAWYKKRGFIVLLVLLCIMLVGTSYALWQITLKQETTNIITTGCFNIEFEDKNPITLENAYPITDEEGKKLTPYTFTITNTCETLVKYQINLDILETTTLENHSYIKVAFGENEASVLASSETVNPTIEEANSSYKLAEGVLAKMGSKTFNLRLWMNETTPATTDAMNKTFASKIVLNTIQATNYYTEDILNGADPVLKDNLVPVTIEPNGNVTKANINEKWYSYEEKIWANAVILKDETIKYADGASIPESNIESYFVWIPRYKYKIFNDEKYSGVADINSTKVQRIEVEFESKDVTSSNGTKKEEWLTHPAFTSFNTNGMWVGKFETGRSTGLTDNEINPTGVEIKPNKVAWRKIQIGKIFYTSYYYQRNLDSHMMKNSEWGAVAYLQHSKYGSETSIRINNNSNYITGYASVVEPTCGYTNDNRACNKYGTTSDITLPYNTETGYLASTTGNISGIYDMSGGAWEYVMGVMTDQNGNPLSGRNAQYNSAFIGGYGEGGSLTSGYQWPEEKYYDKYNYGTNYSEFARGHFGDATFEMGPFKKVVYNNIEKEVSSWYSNHAQLVYINGPWFTRGNVNYGGNTSGVFAFGSNSGGTYEAGGFRIVLTP